MINNLHRAFKYIDTRNLYYAVSTAIVFAIVFGLVAAGLYWQSQECVELSRVEVPHKDRVWIECESGAVRVGRVER